MSVDNPYYFQNDIAKESSSNKGFTLFRRRSSSNSSNKSNKQHKAKANSSVGSETSLLGNKIGSLKSLLRSSNSGQSFTDTTNGMPINPMDRRGSNTNFYQYRQRLGSYNEPQSYSFNGNDDVFLQSPRSTIQSTSFSETSIDSSLSGMRRHSIGTFVKDKMRCGSISDEVPKTLAPKPPPQISTRQRIDRKHDDKNRMDDILIVTARQSEPAILWANYLRTRFDKITKQRGMQPFNFLHIKIDEGPITSDIASRCQSTKLQIVILCSTFISLPSQFLMSQLSVILKPEIVLGIQLDVPEEKIVEIHKNAFPLFKKWRKCSVRNQDQAFIGNVLGIATDILGRALCQRPLCTEVIYATNKTNYSDAFTILPRKVKIGQNKVVALLNEPLQKDDWIKIKIEKCGESMDVINFKKRNPYTLQFTIPDSCMEISTMIEIKIEKNEKELGCRPVKCESRLRELEQILKAQDSPLEFMCNSLGITISDKITLDSYLHQTFQKNIPPNFHLLSGPPIKQTNGFLTNRESSSEEYPTLLHFAAKWGLEHFSLQLMECPGGETACEIRNVAGKTPAELAEANGYMKLANSLKSFSQMNEFTTMYHYFKGISDTNTITTKVVIEQIDADKMKQNGAAKKTVPPAITEEYMEMSGSDHDSGETINAVTNLNYINIDSSSDDINKNLNDFKITEEPEVMTNELKILEPAYYDSNEINKSDAFSQECLNVLENCKSLNSSNDDSQSDYLIQPSNIPVKNIVDFNILNDYLVQPSNKPVNSQIAIDLTDSDYMIQPSNRKVSDFHDESHLKMKFMKNEKCKNSTLKRQGSDTSKTSVDDELLEIMNDFKNNVFTIQEVEQLVVSWKNRNDVKQSYKDKQEQLQKMRYEYERIQAQMKDKMKRPTPFERVKKLFSRNKSISIDDINGDENKTRPMSSLSLQSISSSSSSSGRMSTGSVCSSASLGDSGTHSDHEDRRNIFSNVCRVGTPGSLMDCNYLTPPAPRPVSSLHIPKTIDEKSITNFSNTKQMDGICENYSMFPSNVPVYGHAEPQVNHHDYMNFSGLNTIDETKETGNEVAAVTFQPIKVQKPDAIYSPIRKKTNDLCSSFKPPTTNVITFNDDQSIQFKKKFTNNHKEQNHILSKKNINEIYKNLNDLELSTSECLKNFNKTVTECNDAVTSSSKSAHTCNLDINDRANHDYMNV